MNCRKANKSISAFIDVRLNEKDRLALLEHMKVCPDCKKLYEKTKALIEKLRELPEVPLPEGAENRIHFALERAAQKPRKKKWIKFAAIAMPATAAVFAAVLGISYLFSGGLTKRTNDTTAMAPAKEEAIMQKSMITEGVSGTFDAVEPEIADEATRTLEQDAEEENLVLPMPEPDTYVNVVFEGESAEQMSAFVEDILGSFGAGDDQTVIFDDETQSIKITLPGESYGEFMDVVESSENLTLAERNEWLSGADDEGGLLFEVNFLFQKKQLTRRKL